MPPPNPVAAAGRSSSAQFQAPQHPQTKSDESYADGRLALPIARNDAGVDRNINNINDYNTNSLNSSHSNNSLSNLSPSAPPPENSQPSPIRSAGVPPLSTAHSYATSCPSREQSPMRSFTRPVPSPSSSRSASRSRARNSYNAHHAASGNTGNNANAADSSPSRPPASQPATAAVLRSLNDQKPQLQPPYSELRPSDSLNKMPSSTRSESSRRPSRIPSPVSSRRQDPSDIATANMASKRMAQHPGETSQRENTQTLAKAPDNDSDELRGPVRALSRGTAPLAPTLATVQEGAVASTPETSTATTIAATPDAYQSDDTKQSKTGHESGSDSGGKSKREAPPRPTARPGEIISKRSFTSLPLQRGRAGDSSARNMIVEAETVSSVPQVPLGDAGASVRPRQSDETIRPKKEKKRPARKPAPPSAASSKADIFEAKVASAVDEADSSDSAETFVYDSNPPDSRPARKRYHSRTPSATSMASIADQYSGRTRALPPGPSITGKRSMKFTNNYNYNTLLDDADDSGSFGGTRIGPLYSRHYYRPGWYGAHQSLLEQAPLASQQRAPRHNMFSGGRHLRAMHRFGGKSNADYGYDVDEEGADDERTPLVNSRTLPRSRHGRRPGSASLRQMEYFEQKRRSWWMRYGLYSLFVLLLVLAVAVGTAVLFTMAKPLKNVALVSIDNILASEQELMLDMRVRATNPNIVAFTISDLDVNIFAKSKYVGSDALWRLHHNAQVRPTGGVDEGTDPIDEIGDPSTMLLGRVLHFDAPLTFDPSPLRYQPATSAGQIRLAKPGNKTEAGGTERWERVLRHQFELILRGTLQYPVPLGSTIMKQSIGGHTMVRPNEDGVDHNGTMPKYGTSPPTALLPKNGGSFPGTPGPTRLTITRSYPPPRLLV